MNKHFLCAISLLCMIGLSVSNVHSQQNLLLKLKDGSEKRSALSSIRKITFLGTNLILNYKDGASSLYSDASIQKLFFGVSSGVQELIVDKNLLMVYPNPASSFISLKNVPDVVLNVSIYRLDGTVLLSTQILSDGDQIDVSKLTKGFYLLKVNNTALKFMKL